MTRSVHSSFITACAFAANAQAAGGHFDVDDAAVAEPGHCQYETWLARAPAASATLFHLGSACRVGPVELGFNVDRFSTAGETRSALGPQLKWVADPLVGPLSAGIAWSAAGDLKRGGRPAHTLYVPLTWAVNDKIALNANLGADWDFAGARTRRVGVSGEWIAHDKLTMIVERVKFAGEWTSRLGARFMLNESISVDLSAARAGPHATRVYAIGLNHDFAR
ncbi:MAG: hypothetical protein ABI781_16660 [Burkholderiales bacterium]